MPAVIVIIPHDDAHPFRLRAERKDLQDLVRQLNAVRVAKPQYLQVTIFQGEADLFSPLQIKAEISLDSNDLIANHIIAATVC